MKRIVICMILIVVMLFAGLGSLLASEPEMLMPMIAVDNSVSAELDWDNIPAEFRNSQELIVEPMATEDYRTWAQTDGRWGGLRLGSSSCTVAGYGCTVTALTKLIIQHGCRSADTFNVATLVNWLNSNNGFTSSGALYWNKPAALIDGMSNYGDTADSGSSSSLTSKIVNYVNNNYGVLLNVNNGGHWVAVDGAKTKSTGQVYIMDSLSSSANADILLTSRYASVDRIHLYSFTNPPEGIDTQPGKPSWSGMSSTYTTDDTITFRWTETENTTHYNLYFDAMGSDGNYFRNETIHYAENGLSRQMPEGKYKVVVQATNSNSWDYDENTWPYTNSDPFYFEVKTSKRSGTCGDNLVWELDLNVGTLTIAGTGEMYDFSVESMPWADYGSSIVRVVLQNGVETIGDHAFYGCYNAISVEIPKSVTSIGERAFGSWKITSVTIPEGVTSIGESAFCDCCYLTTVELPDSLLEIGGLAFYGCDSLETICIPKNVTTIGSNPFAGAKNLRSIEIDSENTRFTFANGFLLKDTVLLSYAQGCSGAAVFVPQEVTAISDYAFYGNDSVIHCFLRRNVSTIGSYAFSYCDNLIWVDMCWSTTTIGSNAFYACASLSTLFYTGNEALWKDTVIRSGNDELLNANIEYQTAFVEWEDDVIWNMNLETGILKISGAGSIPDPEVPVYHLRMMKASRIVPYLKKVVITEDVTTIGSYAFISATNLTEIELSENVHTVKKYAFASTGLTALTISDSVTYLEKNAFEGCTSLKTVQLGSGLTTINSEVFNGCAALKSITISGSITSIDANAFRNCTALTDVYYQGTQKQWNAITVEAGNEYLLNATIHFIDCTHPVLDVVHAVEPTCQSTGNIAHWYCDTCGAYFLDAGGMVETSYDDTILPVVDHKYEDNACIWCGEAEYDLFDLYGASMTLGNDLSMNFFVQKSLITDTNWYARITKTGADGTEDRVTDVPVSQWETSGSYYRIVYDGLAAKEMADEIQVQIFNGSGAPVSVVWTDSIRAYAMRVFDKQSSEMKTLLADMLNYGAAAQTQFAYNTDDLANNQLTAAQQACATQSVSLADHRIKATNYYGTALVLETNIQLSLYFTNLSADMYAIVTYKDHYDTVKTVTIPGSEFVANGRYWQILVDELVVADARQPVTCQVFDSDGTVAASVTDSVESYAARMTNSVATCEMLMKFADSAYNYFH